MVSAVSHDTLGLNKPFHVLDDKLTLLEERRELRHPVGLKPFLVPTIRKDRDIPMRHVERLRQLHVPLEEVAHLGSRVHNCEAGVVVELDSILTSLQLG